jgi:hypothetical protein
MHNAQCTMHNAKRIDPPHARCTIPNEIDPRMHRARSGVQEVLFFVVVIRCDRVPELALCILHRASCIVHSDE